MRAACPLESGPKIPQVIDRVELHVRTLMQYMTPITAWGLCLVFLMVDWCQLWRGRGPQEKLRAVKAPLVFRCM